MSDWTPNVVVIEKPHVHALSFALHMLSARSTAGGGASVIRPLYFTFLQLFA